MKVEFVWSMDANRYACLHVPHGITLVEFEELERAVQLQLSAVRKSLEAEQPPEPPPVDNAFVAEGCEQFVPASTVTGDL